MTLPDQGVPPEECGDCGGLKWTMGGHCRTCHLYDYRCQNGHPFSAPPAEHGGPWSTLVCPVCGSTGTRHSVPEAKP